MTRDEAVSRMKETLQRDDIDDRLARALQEAQRHREQGTSLPPWLVERATINLVAGTATVALPSDFLRETDDETMRYTPDGTDSPAFVYRKYYNDAVAAYASSDPSGPKVFVVRFPTDILFFPVPDDDYVLSWSYYKRGDFLATGSDTNEWLTYAPELLIAEAGVRIARTLRDQGALEDFSAMLLAHRQALMNEIVEDEVASGGLTMGANL